MKVIDVLRVSYGALLAAAPGPVLRMTGGAANGRLSRTVVRTLGVRHIVQGVLSARMASVTTRRVGAGVDALHALTDLGCAALNGRQRRPAVIDACIASAFGSAALATPS